MAKVPAALAMALKAIEVASRWRRAAEESTSFMRVLRVCRGFTSPH